MAALNPFEIFGLKPQFRIDKQKLDEKYFEIQKKVHPDRFASASDAEKRVAQQWATLINDAYQKLSDPIQCGKVLCALRACRCVRSARCGAACSASTAIRAGGTRTT